MEAVLITVYLIIVLALIAVILLQRSEGGGLGMGGGNNGVMAVRGQGNILTRTTAILATLFFATAIGLTVLTEINRPAQSILERAADGIGEGADAPTTVLDALNAMQNNDSGLAIPELAGDAPAPGADAVGDGPTNPASDPALAVPALEAPATTGTEPAADAPAASGEPAASGTPAAPVN